MVASSYISELGLCKTNSRTLTYAKQAVGTKRQWNRNTWITMEQSYRWNSYQLSSMHWKAKRGATDKKKDVICN